jgi:hypothetical protein
MRTTLLLLILLPLAGLAQPPGPPEGSRPFERIEQWKKIRLIEILDMKEDQSVRFFARLNEHDVHRRELHKAKGEALDRLDRLVRNHAAAAELERAIPEVMATGDRIHEEEQKFFLSLGDVLSADQRAKLALFERQFEKELREAMREAQRKRWRQEAP